MQRVNLARSASRKIFPSEISRRASTNLSRDAFRPSGTASGSYCPSTHHGRHFRTNVRMAWVFCDRRVANVCRVVTKSSSSPASLQYCNDASHTRFRLAVSLPTRHRFSNAANRARASLTWPDRASWALWSSLASVSGVRSTFSSNSPPEARPEDPTLDMSILFLLSGLISLWQSPLAGTSRGWEGGSEIHWRHFSS